MQQRVQNYPKHYCGVFGIFGHPNAAELAYYGLYALQHRGQESAGIVTSHEGKFYKHHGMGLVPQVFNPKILHDLVGNVDNVVKPWLISQGSNMPFVLIFFGVIGGALAFGFIGVFLGPTLLAVGYRLLEEWKPAAPEPAAGGKDAGAAAVGRG